MPDLMYYGDLRRLRKKNPDAPLSVLQGLAGMGRYAREQDVSIDMYETPEQMLEDLQARRGKERPANAPQPQPEAPRQPRASFSPAYQQPQGASPVLNPAQQFAHSQGMAAQANNAIRDEMDSRVSQERDRQRMEHQKELVRMQMEAQRRADEASLIRALLSDM
jgi:hypothetical protein